MIYCTHSNPKEKENSKIAPLEMAIDWRLLGESESVRYQHNGDGSNEALYHIYIHKYIHIIYICVCLYIYICDLVKVGV